VSFRKKQNTKLTENHICSAKKQVNDIERERSPPSEVFEISFPSMPSVFSIMKAVTDPGKVIKLIKFPSLFSHSPVPSQVSGCRPGTRKTNDSMPVMEDPTMLVFVLLYV